MLSSLVSLFPELIEDIVSWIDYPADILSLALTCRLLNTICIPNHLLYRRIAVKDYFLANSVWKHLANSPVPAANIRVLEIGKRTDIHFPHSVLEEASLDADNTSLTEIARKSLEEAFSVMTGLSSLIWTVDPMKLPRWNEGSGYQDDELLWPVCRSSQIFPRYMSVEAKFVGQHASNNTPSVRVLAVPPTI